MYLQKEVGFTLSKVEVSDSQKQQTYGKHKIIMDAGSRYRDLTPIFRRGGFKENFIEKLLKVIQGKNTPKMGVMFFPGGKHESYFRYLNRENDCNINWIIPLNQDSNLFYKKNKNISFYYLNAIESKSIDKTNQIIFSLKENIKKYVTIIDHELLINSLERHVSVHFNGAYNFI